MEKFTKKKMLLVLYGIIIILGLSFFLEPLRSSDLGTFIVVGLIRYFMSNFVLRQLWSTQLL